MTDRHTTSADSFGDDNRYFVDMRVLPADVGGIVKKLHAEKIKCDIKVFVRDTSTGLLTVRVFPDNISECGLVSSICHNTGGGL